MLQPEAAAMLFMVIESVRNRDAKAAVPGEGRMVPDGVKFVGSRVTADLRRCVQLGIRDLSDHAVSAARLALLLSFVTFSRLVFASETGLSGSDGHPRERFPLAAYVQPLGDAKLDAIVRRAIVDWNAVFRDTLGVQAFAAGAQREKAKVVVEFEPATSPRMMGETDVQGDAVGVIALPVRVLVFEPRARGQTSRETVLYQIVAHELGHALGLVHMRDPHSLMCCVAGSVDFKDPAAREAYIKARRHPDIRSVRGQLAEHYERFWHGRH